MKRIKYMLVVSPEEYNNHDPDGFRLVKGDSYYEDFVPFKSGPYANMTIYQLSCYHQLSWKVCDKVHEDDEVIHESRFPFTIRVDDIELTIVADNIECVTVKRVKR